MLDSCNRADTAKFQVIIAWFWNVPVNVGFCEWKIIKIHTIIIFSQGPSDEGHVNQPKLHRDVERLENLCVHHVTQRLLGHHYPIMSLGGLPHPVCDKILAQLIKNKNLTPKTFHPFLTWWASMLGLNISFIYEANTINLGECVLDDNFGDK